MKFKLVASIGITSYPPPYGWDMGHATSAPSCLSCRVNWDAVLAPGCSWELSAMDGDVVHVCVCAWPRYHTLLFGTASGPCPLPHAVLFLAERGKHNTLPAAKGAGRWEESPAAAGAKQGSCSPDF